MSDGYMLGFAHVMQAIVSMKTVLKMQPEQIASHQYVLLRNCITTVK